MIWCDAYYGVFLNVGFNVLETLMSDTMAFCYQYPRSLVWALSLLWILSGCADAPEFVHTPQMPRNLTPEVDSSHGNGLPVTFQWRAVELASEYEFHVFDRSNAAVVNERSKLYPERICVDSICSIEEVLSLPLMSGHAWRVRAVNFAGPSPWSRSTFTVNR